MCGRFVSSGSLPRLVERFGIDEMSPAAAERLPSWNLAPTDGVRAVVDRGGARRLELLRWGLVPRWAKGPKAGAQMINARAETMARSPAFGSALLRRRAIVPMDGFYEWARSDGGRPVPFYFARRDGEPLAVAGIWEAWRDTEDHWLASCALITIAANATVAHIHHRMPAVLKEPSLEAWLDPGALEPEEAVALARSPVADDLLGCWRVDLAVNHVANNWPELVEPVAG